jgi:tRNA(fMet)-specific endonuclease VapC
VTAVRYLLDTNAASDILRAQSEPMMRRVERAPAGSLYVSVITEAELRFGLEKHPEAVRRRAVVLAFLSRVKILPWDSDTAAVYARERAKVERTGQSLGAMDMLIAAQAVAEEMVLVTRGRGFGRFAGLRLEDWTL